MGFFAGGVANAVYASKNADDYNEIEMYCDLDRAIQDNCDTLRTIRDSERAAAVSLCVYFQASYKCYTPCRYP